MGLGLSEQGADLICDPKDLEISLFAGLAICRICVYASLAGSVAQLDRASAFEAEGYRFESYRGRHHSTYLFWMQFFGARKWWSYMPLLRSGAHCI